jgi:hypothetical protein
MNLAEQSALDCGCPAVNDDWHTEIHVPLARAAQPFDNAGAQLVAGAHVSSTAVYLSWGALTCPHSLIQS